MDKTEKIVSAIPSAAELEQLAELHKAMGDHTRMRILCRKNTASVILPRKSVLQNPLYPTNSVHCGLFD